MNILSLFQQTKTIDGEQARALLDQTPSDEIQLVDVRQPSEYSQEHIPGAHLIPLKELPTRLPELEPSKKTVVYCRSGVRSKAGCQILRNSGFTDVLNMTGGILRWQGHKASGSEIAGFENFIGADFSSGCRMAWNMEKALQEFYLFLEEQTGDLETKQLLQYMARLEDGHMAKLSAQHDFLQETSEPNTPATTLEGAIDKEQFLATFRNHLNTTEEILHASMMFEAQAYDLYSRLARQEKDDKLKRFYEKMAEEEQNHLEKLTKELEKRIM